MKARHYMLLIVAGVAAFLAGLFVGEKRVEKTSITVTETKETTVDTIQYCAPKPQWELAKGTRRYTLPSYCFVGRKVGSKPRCINRDSIVSTSADNSVTPEDGAGTGGEQGCGVEDSVVVELPMMQRHYADSTYEAWVSGAPDARLDSIRVFAPTTMITKREREPRRRWHIGVTTGCGYGTNGVKPYIGVGITYSIISF